jgi:hypothetical protein
MAKRFILFHHQRHPADMGVPEIRTFLTHLTVGGQVAASTQNIALQALIFLYRHVLKQPFPELEAIEQARKSQRVPVVSARPPRAAAGRLCLLPVGRPASGAPMPGGGARSRWKRPFEFPRLGTLVTLRKAGVDTCCSRNRGGGSDFQADSAIAVEPV